MKIRNWRKFQHFKDRRPPWVKLHREILDDRDWHSLSGDDSKTLIMLWLLASEDEDKDGQLPCVEDIAFRLRTTEIKVNQSLTRLKKWVIHSDITVISERYQVGPPETETETETETDHFDDFWSAYPRKEAKASAKKAFDKLCESDQLSAIAALSTFDFSDDKKYQPHPASWLNAARWEDEGVQVEDAFAGFTS